MNKNWAFILAGVLVIAAAFYLFNSNYQQSSVSNFEECAQTGQPIMESYPRKCIAGGQTFVEDIGDALNKADLVKVTSPIVNGTIKSPLALTGEARGYWYFEAAFPVKLVDEQNNVLASTTAKAQGEWMTGDFVPFSATLDFTLPAGVTRGSLILEKDNPSGDPTKADSFRLPVKFE